MKRISLFLSLIQIKKLRSLSVESGIKFSEHIRRAIDNYLERNS